ncbi:MAG: hypothetical protein GWO24_06065, partial [Akkermansiaceae bacterium]|nr:hypothetical protein [Akkermansiaceae bacterium]
DADDLLLPGKIRRQVEALEESGADAIMGDFLRLMNGEKKEPLNFHSRDRFESVAEFVMYTLPLVGRCLYKLDLVRDAEGFAEFKRSEDFVFHFKLIAMGAKWIYQPDKLFLYRVYDDQNRLSSLASVAKTPGEAKERIIYVEKMMKEHDCWDDTVRKAMSYDCYRQAVSFYRLGMRDYGDLYLAMSKGYWDPPVIRGRGIYETLHRTLGPRLAGKLLASPLYRFIRRVIK